MNRRLFAGSLLGTSLALVVARVSARQAATPAAERVPISQQPGFVRSVSRIYRLPDPSFSDVMRGGLLGLQVSGIEFDTADNASAAVAFLAGELPGYFARTVEGVTDFDVVEEDVDPMGDEQSVQTVALSFPEQDVISELLFGIVLVRKDNLIQAAAGYGIEDATSQTLDVLAALDDRWPDGDLWAMVPESADVPDGLELSEEEELLPGE
jgi:hypothetical protein